MNSHSIVDPGKAIDWSFSSSRSDICELKSPGHDTTGIIRYLQAFPKWR